MKVFVAQINPQVGDWSGTFKLVSEAVQQAEAAACDLLVFPEMIIPGYVAHDLFDRPEIFAATENFLKKVADLSRSLSTAIALGHLSRNPHAHGRAGYNSISVYQKGECVHHQSKRLLPTYDVFDESRYFEPGAWPEVFLFQQKKIAFGICEDLWFDSDVGGKKIYADSWLAHLKKIKPDLLISLSASPFEHGKLERRIAVHAEIAQTLSVPLIYVNQTGASDEILFDGQSFWLDARGRPRKILPAFSAQTAVFFPLGEDPSEPSGTPNVVHRNDFPSKYDLIYKGLVQGIRDYFKKTGLRTAILGLSGGIDSTLVALLAKEALGAKNVFGVAMPSPFSSLHSIEDAERFARENQIAFEIFPIKFMYANLSRELGQARGGLKEIAGENMQARMRGLILMTLSNHYGALVLSTGNKSEIAVGYTTLYGDMCGALAPIGDLYKTEVYALCDYLIKNTGHTIPAPILTKAPSAELKPNQTDQDTLPPYAKLDAMLIDYLENQLSVEKLVIKHGPWVIEWVKKTELAEFKRRQGAPILKVSKKAFGLGRRMPLTKANDWFKAL